MKPIIVSSILLALVITLLIFNAVYIENLTEKLIGITAALPASVSSEYNKDTEYGKMTDLFNMFNNSEKIIALSHSYTDIDRLKSTIISMKGAFLCDQFGDYLIARDKLLNYLHRLECNEQISMDNIS